MSRCGARCSGKRPCSPSWTPSAPWRSCSCWCCRSCSSCEGRSTLAPPAPCISGRPRLTHFNRAVTKLQHLSRYHAEIFVNFRLGGCAMKAVLIRWCLVLAVCSCGFLRLQAQAGDAAAVTGTVLDVAGKAIPNAAVSVRNESTGAARMAMSSSDGKYSVTGLPVGTYSIEVSAPSFATSRRAGVKLPAGETETAAMTLNVGELSQTVTVEGTVSVAAEMAPSQSTLEARSAKSEISPDFVQNFASPVADYTELLNMAPGTFSVNPNGVGLGDSKTYFRGFADGQYTMLVDGIPFNDTNSPTHHSWAFFPSQFIAGIDFDRSPGSAASIGPTNFGGTVDLLSRSVAYTPDIRATASYGSFNTRMLALDIDSGQFGPGKKSSLTVNLHQMLSDGYQTYNYQKRVAGFIKYQYRLNDRTTFTLFSGLVDLWTNTPNLKGPSRAQIAEFGDNYLLSGDPSQPNYYGYNFYHVQTDFSYMGVTRTLGHVWKLNTKVNPYRTGTSRTTTTLPSGRTAC